jgi:glycosyltransferase involved in cell wall biosynthesis
MDVSEIAPQVSIVIPCRNEIGWIARCLQSILDNDFPKDRLEVLVVDGMSDDGTRAVIEAFARQHPWVRIVDNPKRITPIAMNLGIAAARGRIVMRMDAHVEYPTRYVSALVERLESSRADNVGCVCITCAANDTAVAKAIAIGMSHPLGVGNSYFRIGIQEPRWVDTVPFGCYRREVFDRIGLFDEELIRNQDDELNLRLLRAGGRILLVPDVVCRYFARNSLPKLWRMYYQYGFFKPLVARKVGRVMTLRQLVPAVFVLTLAVAAIGSIWSWYAALAGAVVMAAYVAVIAVAAVQAGWRQGLGCMAYLGMVFPTLHLSYGLGYLHGIVQFVIFRRKLVGRGTVAPISR